MKYSLKHQSDREKGTSKISEAKSKGKSGLLKNGKKLSDWNIL